jgi:hypothetical protein
MTNMAFSSALKKDMHCALGERAKQPTKPAAVGATDVWFLGARLSFGAKRRAMAIIDYQSSLTYPTLASPFGRALW